MKKITITFTADQFVELAKQLYLGSYLTIGFPYDNEEMAFEIYNKVCKTGYHKLPVLDAFKHCGPMNDTEFDVTDELSTECEVIIE